jgi:hypothetical protein
MALIFAIPIAMLMSFVIFKIGYAMLGSFGSPMPPPPPPGIRRRVKLRYQCLLCGMELRVTAAPDEVVLPPRHCMDEMEYVPGEDD